MFKYLEKLYYKTNITIFSCAVTYIIDKGIDTVKKITDDDVKTIEGNGLMTAEYCQAIVRTARDIVHLLDSPTELIQFCDSMSLYETSLYTHGECADRSTLEKAIRILINHELYDDSVRYDNLDDLADYLDMEVDEIKSLIER